MDRDTALIYEWISKKKYLKAYGYFIQGHPWLVYSAQADSFRLDKFAPPPYTDVQIYDDLLCLESGDGIGFDIKEDDGTDRFNQTATIDLPPACSWGSFRIDAGQRDEFIFPVTDNAIADFLQNIEDFNPYEFYEYSKEKHPTIFSSIKVADGTMCTMYMTYNPNISEDRIVGIMIEFLDEQNEE